MGFCKEFVVESGADTTSLSSTEPKLQVPSEVAPGQGQRPQEWVAYRAYPSPVTRQPCAVVSSRRTGTGTEQGSRVESSGDVPGPALNCSCGNSTLHLHLPYPVFGANSSTCTTRTQRSRYTTPLSFHTTRCLRLLSTTPHAPLRAVDRRAGTATPHTDRYSYRCHHHHHHHQPSTHPELHHARPLPQTGTAPYILTQTTARFSPP